MTKVNLDKFCEKDKIPIRAWLDQINLSLHVVCLRKHIDIISQWFRSQREHCGILAYVNLTIHPVDEVKLLENNKYLEDQRKETKDG
jgi:hypothetical protein